MTVGPTDTGTGDTMSDFHKCFFLRQRMEVKKEQNQAHHRQEMVGRWH
jgi:hypothetical protein